MVSQLAGGLEVGFEGSLKLEFTGTRITSDHRILNATEAFTKTANM